MITGMLPLEEVNRPGKATGLETWKRERVGKSREAVSWDP